MALAEVLFIVALVTLLVSSFTDIRRREVPDWMNYSFLAAALGIRSIYSFQGGWNVLLSGFLGLAIAFVVGSIFYVLNQWGGGDAKLLMGMGAALGITYPFSSASFTLLWFFLALLFIGAIYGLMWMIIITIRKPQPVGRHFRFLMDEYKSIHIASGCIAGFFIFSSLKLSFLWPLAIFPLALFYLFLFVESVEQIGFFKDVSVSRLTEGDWLAEDIFVEGRRVVKARTLERKELAVLNRLRVEGKLKTVLIKEGIPFVPSFLAAFLLIQLGMGWVEVFITSIF